MVRLPVAKVGANRNLSVPGLQIGIAAGEGFLHHRGRFRLLELGAGLRPGLAQGGACLRGGRGQRLLRDGDLVQTITPAQTHETPAFSPLTIRPAKGLYYTVVKVTVGSDAPCWFGPQVDELIVLFVITK